MPLESVNKIEQISGAGAEPPPQFKRGGLTQSPLLVILLVANLCFSLFIATNLFSRDHFWGGNNTQGNSNKTLNQNTGINSSVQNVPTLHKNTEGGSAVKALPEISGSSEKNNVTAAEPVSSSESVASGHQNLTQIKSVQFENPTAIKNHNEGTSPNSHRSSEDEPMETAIPISTLAKLQDLPDWTPGAAPKHHRNATMHVPPPPGAGSIFSEVPQISKMDGIVVTAVMGNRAMLQLERPRRYGQAQMPPENVCLAPGEHVRTPLNANVSIVSVENDRVTLDIDGDRFVKSLKAIR